jgi:RNA polymerase sigma-70 factor (ECF subfamily)
MSEKEILREQEVLGMLASDDVKVISRLYAMYHVSLEKIAYRFTGRRSAAHDLVMDLVLHLWDKRHQLNLRHPLFPYLSRAVINDGINYARKEARKKELFSEYNYETVVASNVADVDVEYSELKSIVERTIEKLPGTCRETFLLHRNGMMTYQKIAERMGVSKKTVEKRISRALKVLRLAVRVKAESLKFKV